jgi:dTDP-4-dehydrorhamnose 3,5-epimerase
MARMWMRKPSAATSNRGDRGNIIRITQLNLPGVMLIEPERFGDARGFFSEVYNERAFAEAGIDHHWVQDNHAFSRERWVLRGLHFQAPPHAQAKLIRVATGAIFDVVVDLREGTSTFGRFVTVRLSAEAWNQILVPVGCAHGYLTLEPATQVLYKVDDYHAADLEGGIIWNDPDIGIDWPLEGEVPILSVKDQAWPRLKDLRTPFDYAG